MRAVLCLAGGIASGKTTVGKALAASSRGAHLCSFGDVVRRQALRQGTPSDRASLQAVGATLVAAGWPAFVDLLLEDTPGRAELLVVDGIRHVEAVTELATRFPNTPVRLIYLRADRDVIAGRLHQRGEPEAVLDHPIESSLHEVAAAAELELDSSLPVDELLSQITRDLDRVQDHVRETPPPCDLQRLVATLRTFAIDRGWQHYHGPKNLVMALTGEVGELAAIFQWLSPSQAASIMNTDKTARSVREEVADVLIYTLYLCDRLGLDPSVIIEEKMTRNGTRFPPSPKGLTTADVQGTMSDPETFEEAMVRLCETQESAELSFPFGPDAMVFKVHTRIFAVITTKRDPTRLTLKCDPDLGEHLTRTHPSVNPGYHMNKRHWISIELDGSVPEDLICDLVLASYDRVAATGQTPRPRTSRCGATQAGSPRQTP